jgi:hypothetical protein
MVHVVTAVGSAPFGIVLQKFDIELVKAAGCPDVEGAFADLFDGGDPGQRQEEAEMVREVLITASLGVPEARDATSGAAPRTHSVKTKKIAQKF